MVDDAYKVGIPVDFKGRAWSDCLLDVLLNKLNEVLETLVKSHQDKLQALGLVLGSIFALSLDYLKYLTVQQDNAFLEVSR